MSAKILPFKRRKIAVTLTGDQWLAILNAVYRWTVENPEQLAKRARAAQKLLLHIHKELAVKDWQ